MLVKCPICQKSAVYKPSNEFRPFCSHRCQQQDIANWADGQYRIGGDDDPMDIPDGEGGGST